MCFSGTVGGVPISGMFPDSTTLPFNVLKSDGTTFPVYFSGEVFPTPAQYGMRCTKLDVNGNAVFELISSDPVTADVVAKFVPEGVTRHIDVKEGIVSSFQDNPPLTPAMVLANPGQTVGTGSNGTSEPTQAQFDNTIKVAIAGGFGLLPTATAAPAAPAQITPVKTITVAKTVKVKMLTLRLVRPLHGKPYFLVKVQSPHKLAKITIVLKNKHGKTLSKVTKTVQANKLLKLKSSHITSLVKKIGVVLVK